MNSRWTWADSVQGLLIFLLLEIGTGILNRYFAVSGGGASAGFFIRLGALGIAPAAIVAIFLLVKFWRSEATPPHAATTKLSPLRELAFACATLIALGIVFAVVNALVPSGFLPSSNPRLTSFVSAATKGEWMAVAVVFGILFPILRELFFRKMLLGYLQTQMPGSAAIAVQAGLFAACFWSNGPWGVAFAFFLGVALGILYTRRKSILAPLAVVIVLSLVGLGGTAKPLESHRPKIGVGLARNEAGKLYVYAIVPGSAGDLGGVKVGDLVTEFDGQSVNTPEEVRLILERHQVGDVVKAKLHRGEAEIFATLQLLPP